MREGGEKHNTKAHTKARTGLHLGVVVQHMKKQQHTHLYSTQHTHNAHTKSHLSRGRLILACLRHHCTGCRAHCCFTLRTQNLDVNTPILCGVPYLFFLHYYHPLRMCFSLKLLFCGVLALSHFAHTWVEHLHCPLRQ